MKTGLVLEGGGMRGIYTAGVLDVMDEAGLRPCFDGVIGVSAGAVHGCSFVSGQRGRSIRYFTKVLPRPGLYERLFASDHGQRRGRKALLPRYSRTA